MTPLMQQYHTIKQQYADALVFFQVGDFFELFFDDARIAASFLAITLTSRGKHLEEDIPLCGVPVHALDHYLGKLIDGGFKVAICEQLEEPQPGKVVRRGVTRVLTPGTLTDTKFLDEKSASYVLSLSHTKDKWGLVFGELLTAQLFATVVETSSFKSLENEIARFLPDEIIIPATAQGKECGAYFAKLGYYTTLTTLSEQESADTWLTTNFAKSRDILKKHHELYCALCNFYGYIKKNQESAVGQFSQLTFYEPQDYLVIDAATQRNLELIANTKDGGRQHTLLEVLDDCATSMGSRLLKKWLVRPLVSREPIEHRQDVVQQFVSDPVLADSVAQCLRQIADIERVLGRIALDRAPLHDYVHLAKSLAIIPQIKHCLQEKELCHLLGYLVSLLGDFEDLYLLLHSSLNDDPEKDCLIQAGYNQEIDRLRMLIERSNELLLQLEHQEQNRTGIQSLKVRHNNVHGYYIEVTKTNLDAVPAFYIRTQTLAGKERFTTPELKKLEAEILTARSQIEMVEKEVFEQIKKTVRNHLRNLRQTAQALAHIDAVLSFARVAYRYGYVRPTFTDAQQFIIQQGKHPVIEKILGSTFIANDIALYQSQRLWLITGPNMGGKSTFLRQVALLALMAQCGSFIPAKSAQLPLLDKIFSRIGAGDNLAQGKSTFLVEMEETAVICTQATEKSLIILDEVGRGTSTVDGLALAQAVVEYIHTNVRAYCLFATHYHELGTLGTQFPGIVSYHAASKKIADEILFLYKMIPGVADGSFGLEVAKLAHVPNDILARAEMLIADSRGKKTEPPITDAQMAQQITYLTAQLTAMKEQLTVHEKLLAELHKIDTNSLSPKQAFDVLWQLREKGLF